MATPMQLQYKKLKDQFPSTILLFRLGDFYEAFNEDAAIVSKVLGITLTGRGKGETRTPMAGIPYHSLENYLPKLVAAGYKVAMAEQLTEPEQGKIVERDVTKIHTPGTYIDENSLSEKKNHYIVCIHICDLKNSTYFYLSSLDLSTGEFWVETYHNLNSLVNSIRKIIPAEILVSDKNKSLDLDMFGCNIELIPDDDFDLKRSFEILVNHFKVTNLKGFGFDSNDQEIIPMAILLRYAQDNHRTDLNHITKIQKVFSTDYMNLDFSTIRNLELIDNIRSEGDPFSLLEILDNCMTSMGTRLLRSWIISPLINADLINQRLKSVDYFYKNKKLTDEVRSILKNVLDLERIVSKIGTGRVNGRDLVGLRNSLLETKSIFELIVSLQPISEIENLLNSLNPLKYEFVTELITKSIEDECPVKFDKGGIIKNGYNAEIDDLRSIQSDGKDFLLNLQVEERERTGIESLKVKFNKVFGYYIEITNTHKDKVPENYIRKQTLVNAERYITPELKEYEDKILSASEKLIELEIKCFQEIVQSILKSIVDIQTIGKTLALIDLFSNFAHLAIDRKYIKPSISSNGSKIRLKQARHPVVEVIKKHEYIPNDIELNENGNLIILTGPNMSGKSTFIRLIALNVLLAQIGSFVPCEEAQIGIVDRIFTRVGASDNLSSGESTFMVEMNETSNILNNSTKRSLLILDEVGRGTSTYDGVAIAWSIVEYIHDKIGATTLFATHYHELIKLEEKLPRVKNYHVHVKDYNDNIVFTHQILRGGMDKSYGLHVAEMAGVPKEVIEKASGILKNFESNHREVKAIKGKKSKNISPQNLQIELL